MPPANVVGVPLHVTVPVYPVPAVTDVTGVAPVTGAVTPAMAVAEMVVLTTCVTTLEVEVLKLASPA